MNKDNMKNFYWVLLICGILILIQIIKCSIEPETPKTPQEIHKDKIKSLFNAWDGSFFKLTAFIKEKMNDPKSYEHVSTSHLDNGDHVIVETKFRGKNAFGVLVLQRVEARVDLMGNVIEIIEVD